MSIKIISFDLDGTLINSNFDTLIWDNLIPKIYAEKKGILFSEAQKFFAEEYMKDISEINVEAKEWFDVKWWIKKYGLNITWEELWKEAQNTIMVFDDVEETVSKLKGTNFVEMFDEIISVSSKYNSHDKGSDVYEKICEEHKIKPTELLHIGDSYLQDVQAPKAIGCQTLFLDRSKKIKSFKTITTLKQVIDYVKNQPN